MSMPICVYTIVICSYILGANMSNLYSNVGSKFVCFPLISLLDIFQEKPAKVV